MRFRLLIGCVSAAVLAALASITYSGVRSATVAEAFESAIVHGEFEKADNMVWSMRNIDLAHLSAVSPELEIELSFEKQSLSDFLLGRKAGRILMTRRCERFAEMYAVDVVASARGVEVARNRATRSDYPTIEESAAGWAAAIGGTIGSLTAVVSNGS